MPVTDAHCHFFSARFFETLARQRDGSLGDDPVGGVTGALGWEPPGPPEALADRWCAELDQHGVARAALADVFTHTLAVVGPDRLLFGTDSSFFPRGWQRAVHDAQRTILADLGLDPQSVDKVFQGNFARLFPTRQG